jgi:hypothetical protein
MVVAGQARLTAKSRSPSRRNPFLSLESISYEGN